MAAGGLALTALAGGGAFLLTHSSNSGSDTAVAADTKSENNSSKSKKDSDSDSSDDTSPSSTISVEMRYAAQSDGKWGLIDDTGAWKVKPTYSDMRLYGAGLAAALDSATGMWGYIDQDGNWAIEPQFSDTRPFNDYGAVAQDAQTSFWGVLNRQGKWIVDAKYYAMGDMVLGNFVPYRSSNEEDSWGYIYIKTGKRNDVPPTFRGLGGWDSANGLGPATQDGTTWGYINGYGQWKIEPQFKAARRFASNRAAVQFDDGSWGYILPDGTRAFSAAFAEAREFANGWAPVKDQATGLWGCSTVSGAWQVEPKFRAMGDIFYTSSDVFLPVQDNESGKWGVLDDAGDWRVMPKFDAII
ncbi:MAG: WG repeat-containing protein [Collinsella sp.]